MSGVSDQRNKKGWFILFCLWALQGMIVLYWHMVLSVKSWNSPFDLTTPQDLISAALLFWVAGSLGLMFFTYGGG